MAGMMTGLLLLLLAGVTVGRVVDLQKRIVGGEECKEDERRYHVKLISNDGTHNFLCGGSLISKEWILTAAHCVKDGRTVKAVLGVHPGDKKEIFEIEEVKIYEKDNVQHDMALLKVKAAKTGGFEIVNLPDCKKRPLNGKTEKEKIVQIAGLAATAAGKDGDKREKGLPKPDTLQCAETDVIACVVKRCTSKVPSFYYDPKKVFCYQRAEVDTMPGDSGGGVVFDKMIYGVHIRGKKEACTRPSKAMDVCDDEYKAWIEGITGRNFP